MGGGLIPPSNSTNRGNRGPENNTVLLRLTQEVSTRSESPGCPQASRTTVSSFFLSGYSDHRGPHPIHVGGQSLFLTCACGERRPGTPQVAIRRHPAQARPSAFSPRSGQVGLCGRGNTGSHFSAHPLPTPLGLHTHRPAAQPGGEAGGGAGGELSLRASATSAL